jgi:hypothetical protein
VKQWSTYFRWSICLWLTRRAWPSNYSCGCITVDIEPSALTVFLSSSGNKQDVAWRASRRLTLRWRSCRDHRLPQTQQHAAAGHLMTL